MFVVVSVDLKSNLLAAPCCGWAKPDTHYVEVMPIVSPEVFVTATSTEICEGEEITFGAVPFAGGTSPTFEWFQNGVSGGTGVSFTPAFINNCDQIYVRMASSYPCPITPTVNSDVITVIVHPRCLSKASRSSVPPDASP